MRILVNKEIRHFLLMVMSVMAAFVLLSQGILLLTDQKMSLPLLFLSLAVSCCITAVFIWYFDRQDRTIEAAVSQIDAFLSGDTDARIGCNQEGELYRLFHAVNTLSAVLSAHAANENREKEFLKNSISDISHQLKTPLAALNISSIGNEIGVVERNGVIWAGILMYAKKYINALLMRFSFVFFMGNTHRGQNCPLTETLQKRQGAARGQQEKLFGSCCSIKLLKRQDRNFL